MKAFVHCLFFVADGGHRRSRLNTLSAPMNLVARDHPTRPVAVGLASNFTFCRPNTRRTKQLPTAPQPRLPISNPYLSLSVYSIIPGICDRPGTLPLIAKWTGIASEIETETEGWLAPHCRRCTNERHMSLSGMQELLAAQPLTRN